MNNLRPQLTLSELIERLEDMKNYEGVSEDTPVVLAYNYGDHSKTQVAPFAKTIEEGVVKYSEYHRMPKVMGESSEQTMKVIIIS